MRSCHSVSGRSVCIVGAPLSHGQSFHGVNKAPEELRESGLNQVIEKLGWRVNDIGDVKFRHENSSADAIPCSLSLGPVIREINTSEYTEQEIPHCRLLGESCGQIADAAYQAAQRGDFVLTIGGDHSIAAGSIAGVLAAHPDLAVVWVDAHGDMNTPEISPSHCYHGMPVSHLIGLFNKQVPGFEWMSHVPRLNARSLAFIGLRHIDSGERLLINSSEVQAFSMKDIDHAGIAGVMKEALQKIDPDNKLPIHLSLDIDGCDPSIAPGTGTKARGGLSYREAHYICETLHETGRLISMDVVEINPDLDQPDEFYHGDESLIKRDSTKTVRLGLELISSALGKVIL